MVEKDERLHLVIAACGLRDHVAALGVADEHDRSGHGPQELGQVGGVTSEIAKRVSESDGTESLTLQGADLRVEARRVGPGAVDEDDRRGLSRQQLRLQFNETSRIVSVWFRWQWTVHSGTDFGSDRAARIRSLPGTRISSLTA